MKSLFFHIKHIIRALSNLVNGNILFAVLFIFITAMGSVSVVAAKLEENLSNLRIVQGPNLSIEPVASLIDDCHPGSGYQWTYGPLQPLIASQVTQALRQDGIETKVNARGYGETDSCNVFNLSSIDLMITIITESFYTEIDQQQLVEEIYPILVDLVKPKLGNIEILFPNGEKISLNDKMLDDQLTALTNTTNWKKIATANTPQARYICGLAYDSERQVTVLFGGDNTGSSRLNDTWEYDGEDWKQVFPAQSPLGRVNIDQTLVYDSNRKKVILFGGLGESTYLNDTWEYDGTSWVEIHTAISPIERDAHAMAFDSARGKTILFGGYQNSTTYLNDTWEYDGEWHAVSPLQTPSGRFHHSMAYDANRHVTILFGGMDIAGQYLGDTWEYDGTMWTQVTPQLSPTPRENHSIAYDKSRGVIVLFGGSNESGQLNDTWEYDGTTWRQIDLGWTPSVRNEMSLVYDSQRSKVVFYGGGYWTSYYNLVVFDDTWEYSEELLPIQGDKKVYVIILDPLLSNGKTLIEYMNWNDPDVLTKGIIDFFQQTSEGKSNYSVVDVTVNNDGWPTLVDGYVYTEDEYLAVLSGQSPPHIPDGVDYNAIVNDPYYDICGKANRGEIDEVWIYNGPYFGFYESTLVGPGAYWYNSPPVPTPFECNKLIPIMAPNPERALDCAIENFGHRTESTMAKVYGSWEQNRISHSWDKFALVDSLSPDFTYSGCGNIHYPPNGTSDYDWANPSTSLSNCDDFANYPNLSDPFEVLLPVTCLAWGCSGINYFQYWFDHFPSNPGCGPDSVANNWWLYFANPAFAINPPSACQTQLIINYNTGKLGSYFTVNGYFFSSNSAVSIEINNVEITSTITTNSNGKFSFVLDSSTANNGFYYVKVTVNTLANLSVPEDISATVSFELDQKYPLRGLSGEGTIISIPSGIGAIRFFMPLIQK